MARKKATDQQLIDWRIGHHVEAAGKMIADALNRVADEMARGNRLHVEEVDLRRAHLMAVLESKEMSDRAAQRLLGMVPEMGQGFVDLRTPRPPDAPDGVRRDGPDWVRDVLEDKGEKPS